MDRFLYFQYSKYQKDNQQQMKGHDCGYCPRIMPEPKELPNSGKLNEGRESFALMNQAE